MLLSQVGTGDIVVLAGSIPTGGTADVYADVIRQARVRGARSIVDTSGAWLRDALTAGPDLCKVNVDELAEAVGARPADCWRRGDELAPSARSLVLSRGAQAHGCGSTVDAARSGCPRSGWSTGWVPETP